MDNGAAEEADLLELYCQLRCHVRWKGGYEVGGDLPSFALPSSPSRELFTSRSYPIQMSVLSSLVLMIGVCKISRVISIVVDDDGLCWMITSHPSIYGINSRRVSTIIYYTSTMAGPPEERQKQLIYERERAREAVCKILWKELREDRQSTNDNVKLFLKYVPFLSHVEKG